jgi:hypothetical protein
MAFVVIYDACVLFLSRGQAHPPWSVGFMRER